MSEERKKPTAGFWITVALVGIPFLYIASCMAVYGLADVGLLPDRARRIADRVFAPIGCILDEIFGGNC
jgi:hypothetical protein